MKNRISRTTLEAVHTHTHTHTHTQVFLKNGAKEEVESN